MSIARFQKALAFSTILVATATLAAAPTLAAHREGGKLSWRPLGGNTVEFSVEMSLRRSFSFPDCGPSPPPGCVITVGKLRFADGSPDSSLALTVTLFNAAEDWLVAVGTVTHTYPAPTAPGGTPWGPFIEHCCRLVALLEGNNDKTFRLETTVDLSGNSAPEVPFLQWPLFSAPSVLVPRVYLQENTPSMFVIRANDADGDSLRWRFATTSESGLVTAVPTGMQLDPSNGVASWVPMATGLYALQVMVEDSSSKVPLDFVVSVKSEPVGICGDGVVTGGEQCDDGNLADGDGCDSSCQVEPGWSCPIPGSPCLRLIGVPPSVPAGLALTMAGPNPATEVAALWIVTPEPGRASLSVYGLDGRRIRRLFDGVAEGGAQLVTWDLADERGRRVAPGVYFARLDFERKTLTRKLIVR